MVAMSITAAQRREAFGPNPGIKRENGVDTDVVVAVRPTPPAAAAKIVECVPDQSIVLGTGPVTTTIVTTDPTPDFMVFKGERS
jgi:hypothetical protein